MVKGCSTARVPGTGADARGAGHARGRGVFRTWLMMVAVLAALALSGVATHAAPMFPDVPDMWAADAVKALSAKGLLEGYPDGTFKGDRAASRYEVAMIVARLLARMEAEHATFASRADMDELRRLVASLKEELDALGTRVGQLEEHYGLLERRVSERERITFYGSFRAIGNTQHVAGAPLVGTLANPAVDYTNGRLVFDGVGESARFMLGVQTRLNEDMDAGLEVAAYVGAGNPLVEQYWGVTPPYNSNPFTAQAAPLPFEQPSNNQPYTRMSLDRFWLQDRPHGYQLVLGSYHPKVTGDYALLGMRNPNANLPTVLPLWGFQVTDLDDKDRLQYEFAWSRLPIGAFYRGWLGAAASSYDFGPVRFEATLTRMGNDFNCDGQLLSGGLIPLPVANNTPLMWRDSRTGNLTNLVGPQDQFIFGGSFNARLVDKVLNLRGNYAHSTYNPDKTKTVLDTTVRGDMASLGLTGKAGQFSADLDYIHVSPTYDTIMLPYATNPQMPVFLPYGSWYSSHYQLHDYLKYPVNREGERLFVNWDGGPTNAFFSLEAMEQVRATTLSQITSPGNAEPLFPVLQTLGAANRGSTFTWGLGASHRFDCGLRLVGSFYNYKLTRGGSVLDNMDIDQSFYRVLVGYPISTRFDVALHYTVVDFTGHTGLTPRNFQQNLPGLTFNWNAARNVNMQLGGRLFNYTDRVTPANNWRGNQVTLDVNVDF